MLLFEESLLRLNKVKNSVQSSIVPEVITKAFFECSIMPRQLTMKISRARLLLPQISFMKTWQSI